jgi:hypothetical protein
MLIAEHATLMAYAQHSLPLFNHVKNIAQENVLA